MSKMEHIYHPKVSVIVPLYNQRRYLKSCIRSISNQTYENLEIIIINDGSTDESPKCARELARIDSRIVVYDKKNEGVAYARRDGLLKATGEFVTFMDNDDLLPSNAIAVMISCMLNNGVDLVIGDARRLLGLIKWRYFESSFPLNRVVSQPELNNYYGSFFGESSFPINVWGRLYRKSVIDRALQETELFSPDIRYLADDMYFNMKLFPYLQSMFMIDEVVYYYRYGGTVDHFNRNYPEVFAITDLRYRLLEQQGLCMYYGALFGEYVNMLYYHAQQLLEFKKGEKEDVISFFTEELSTRSFVPHLIEYFKQNRTDNIGVTFLINRDYELMYNYAYQLMCKRCNRFVYKTKRLVHGIMDKLN